MTSINDYTYSQIDNYEESDYDTVYTNEEEEEEEYLEEEEYEEIYPEYENNEYYYEHPVSSYVSVKETIKEQETFQKVDTSIPKVNPWGLKLDESKKEPLKTFDQILKEESETKRLNDIKKMNLEKENKKRKERFSNSRQKFNFRSNQNSDKKSSLLLNLKTKN